MKLHVSFTVDDTEWGPINGFVLGKVKNLEVTNAVPTKVVVGNGHGSKKETLLAMISRSRNGVDADTLYSKYEELGGTRAAGYQALQVMKKKGDIKQGKDGLYHPVRGRS